MAASAAGEMEQLLRYSIVLQVRHTPPFARQRCHTLASFARPSPPRYRAAKCVIPSNQYNAKAIQRVSLGCAVQAELWLCRDALLSVALIAGVQRTQVARFLCRHVLRMRSVLHVQ